MDVCEVCVCVEWWGEGVGLCLFWIRLLTKLADSFKLHSCQNLVIQTQSREESFHEVSCT
jgi:hypothetical protein